MCLHVHVPCRDNRIVTQALWIPRLSQQILCHKTKAGGGVAGCQTWEGREWQIGGRGRRREWQIEAEGRDRGIEAEGGGRQRECQIGREAGKEMQIHVGRRAGKAMERKRQVEGERERRRQQGRRRNSEGAEGRWKDKGSR